MNFHAPERRREQDCAPRVPKDQRAPDVLPIKQALDGDSVGPKSVQNPLDLVEYLTDSVRERSASSGPHDAALE